MGNAPSSQRVNGAEVFVYNPDLRTCAFCGKAGDNLKRCARCGLVAYCDRKCQKKHYRRGHKKVCKLLQERAPGRHQKKTVEDCRGKMGGDYYVWHEVAGKVYGWAAHFGVEGLPDGDRIHASHFTERKPFKKKLAAQLAELSFKRWQEYKSKKEAKPGGLGSVHVVLTELEQDLGFGRRPHSFLRAFALMHFYPEIFTKDTLRFGSLGYKNEDGSIFWEYG